MILNLSIDAISWKEIIIEKKTNQTDHFMTKINQLQLIN